MNIYTIISKEATEKYADTYLAYNYYEKTRRNKRKKTDIENSNIVKKLTCVPEKEKSMIMLFEARGLVFFR